MTAHAQLQGAHPHRMAQHATTMTLPPSAWASSTMFPPEPAYTQPAKKPKAPHVPKFKKGSRKPWQDAVLAAIAKLQPCNLAQIYAECPAEMRTNKGILIRDSVAVLRRRGLITHTGSRGGGQSPHGYLYSVVETTNKKEKP